ncbi:hypothetical protein A0H76_526 [Hepatospora eriocheir]|uniref:Uncharacterized protein n=1 Tax=Hepatospora eriocheir TaxID=1081669 RepID=A0A1X0Q8K1_9MICR|nr:hypothetical protein A0H76_526 [Hepatospora eriocheir]
MLYGLSHEVPSKFKTVIVINSIERIKIDEVEYGNEESDIEKFLLLAESPLKFKSIAPTIFGHDNIK